MLGWVDDIERATLDNDTFRTVLFTGEHTQLTVMRLGPGRTSAARRMITTTSSSASSRDRLGWSSALPRIASTRPTRSATTGP